MRRRLEDQIRETCGQVVATSDPAELATAIKELRRALREHTQRMRKLIVAKRISPERRRTMPDMSQPGILCSICDMPVVLELCKADEEGRPAHELCYMAKLILEKNLSHSV